MVVLDGKHSKVSKTVKIMSVSITELIWQAKPRGQSIQENYFLWSFDFPMLFYGKAELLGPVPMASTRCQQSLELVQWFFFVE